MERNIDLDQEIEIPESYFLTAEDKQSFVGKDTKIVLVEIKQLDYGITGVFFLNGKTKYWVLKKKVLESLVKKFGPKPKDWIGKEITLTGKLFHKEGLTDGVQISIV